MPPTGTMLLLHVGNRVLPRPQLYRAASAVSRVLMRGKEKRLRRDMRRLFPDKPASWIEESVARQRAHRAWAAIDKLVLSQMSSEEILARIDPRSLDEIRTLCDSVLAEGRGGILYSLHYGRPALSPFVLASLGYPYLGVHSGMSDTGLHQEGTNAMRKLGVELVEARDLAAGVEAFRALKRNKLFFLLVDGRVTQKQTMVDFFGRKVPISLGFAQLARRTGASLAAGVTYSTGPFGFRIAVRRVALPTEPLEPEELGSLLMKPLEELVLEDPGQWYGVNRLFRDVRGSETVR